jgi:catechol 1,2-dioxygenase
MSVPAGTNGTQAANDTTKPHRYSTTFTPSVINAIGPGATPRARQIFSSLFKHVHDFAREVDLTIEEWQTGMDFLDQVGHMYFESGKTRHEMHRISDIIGLERYVIFALFPLFSTRT